MVIKIELSTFCFLIIEKIYDLLYIVCVIQYKIKIRQTEI